MNALIAIKSAALAAAMLSGCVKTGGEAPGQDVPCGTNEVKVSYLCIGMEHSSRFGDCIGCELDATRISTLMEHIYGYNGETLISDRAMKPTVVKKLKEGIARTPEDGLFLFFYSGHGGQEDLGGKEPDGADRQDEFLCLYDTYMSDDEIWSIVSKCRGRVFMYFDACHSATMYRSVRFDLVEGKEGDQKAKAMSLAVPTGYIETTKGFRFRPEKFTRASAMDAESHGRSPRILCWSGCKESELSFGGKNGGTLTICVLSNWKTGMTYDGLWEKASYDVQRYQASQHPVQTYVGDFPKDTEAFR